MNRVIPDPPESYYHPFYNPSGEVAEPEVKCDCGHWSDELEVTDVCGVTYCCNCYDVKLGNVEVVGRE